MLKSHSLHQLSQIVWSNRELKRTKELASNKKRAEAFEGSDAQLYGLKQPQYLSFLSSKPLSLSISVQEPSDRGHPVGPRDKFKSPKLSYRNKKRGPTLRMFPMFAPPLPITLPTACPGTTISRVDGGGNLCT